MKKFVMIVRDKSDGAVFALNRLETSLADAERAWPTDSKFELVKVIAIELEETENLTETDK